MFLSFDWVNTFLHVNSHSYIKINSDNVFIMPDVTLKVISLTSQFSGKLSSLTLYSQNILASGLNFLNSFYCTSFLRQEIRK